MHENDDLPIESKQEQAQGQVPLLPSASSKENEAVDNFLGLLNTRKIARKNFTSGQSHYEEDSEQFNRPASIHQLLSKLDNTKFYAQPFDTQQNSIIVEGSVRCRGRNENGKDSGCSYACVKEGCHEFSFFCANLQCDCKRKHFQHLYEEGSCLRLEDLIKILQQPLRVLKHPELKKWQLLDECIDKMVETLQELKTAHQLAKITFLKRKLPYLFLRELIIEKKFDPANPHFTSDRVRKCLQEYASEQQFRPMYSSGSVRQANYYEPTKYQLETVEFVKHQKSLEDICARIRQTWQFKEPLKEELSCPVAQIKQLNGWTEQIEFTQWFKEDEQWPTIINQLTCYRHLNRLTTIEFSYTGEDGVGDDIIRAFLPLMKNLKSLRVENGGKKVKLNELGARKISSLNNLLILNLRSNSIGDSGLAWICRMANLYKLNVADNGITDIGACHLHKLACLSELHIGWNKFGEAGCQAISCITTLKSLDLENVHVGSAAMQKICRMVRLRQLYIQNTDIGDEGFWNIQNLQRLNKLSVGHNWISSKAAKNIGGLDGLTALYIQSNQLGDEAAAYLSNLSQLEYLVMDGCGIGAEGAMYLGRMASIRVLSLNFNRIDDTAAEHLGRLVNLRTLALNHNKLTGKGVMHFKSLKSMKKLHLQYNRVTHDDRCALKGYLPHIEVHITHN